MRAIGMTRVALFYATMAIVALAALITGGGIQGVLPPVLGNDAWLQWSSQLGLGLLVGLAFVALSRAAAARLHWAARLQEEFRSLLGTLNSKEALLAAVMSGVAEELLFRGVLQPALGLWIAAAIFAALHVGPNRWFAPWTLMAFGIGLLFGLMFAWSGSLLAPIVAHITINFLNLRHLTQEEPGIRVQLAGI